MKGTVKIQYFLLALIVSFCSIGGNIFQWQYFIKYEPPQLKKLKQAEKEYIATRDSIDCLNQDLLIDVLYLSSVNSRIEKKVNASIDNYNAIQGEIIRLQNEYKNIYYVPDTLDAYSNYIFWHNKFKGK